VAFQGLQILPELTKYLQLLRRTQESSERPSETREESSSDESPWDRSGEEDMIVIFREKVSSISTYRTWNAMNENVM